MPKVKVHQYTRESLIKTLTALLPTLSDTLLEELANGYMPRATMEETHDAVVTEECISKYLTDCVQICPEPSQPRKK